MTDIAYHVVSIGKPMAGREAVSIREQLLQQFPRDNAWVNPALAGRHVIIGTFPKLENALELVVALKQSGLAAKVLHKRKEEEMRKHGHALCSFVPVYLPLSFPPSMPKLSRKNPDASALKQKLNAQLMALKESRSQAMHAAHDYRHAEIDQIKINCAEAMANIYATLKPRASAPPQLQPLSEKIRQQHQSSKETLLAYAGQLSDLAGTACLYLQRGGNKAAIGQADKLLRALHALEQTFDDFQVMERNRQVVSYLYSNLKTPEAREKAEVYISGCFQRNGQCLRRIFHGLEQYTDPLSGKSNIGALLLGNSDPYFDEDAEIWEYSLESLQKLFDYQARLLKQTFAALGFR